VAVEGKHDARERAALLWVNRFDLAKVNEPNPPVVQHHDVAWVRVPVEKA
jgi:hypothetical protein